MMNWKILFITMALFIIPVSLLHAQGGQFLKVGPEAVWQGDDKKLIEMVSEECKEEEPQMIGDCLFDVMEEEEASPEALAFVKQIRKEGYLSSYRKAGSVGIAFLTYPFRANENNGYLLVNGSPPAIDVDDLSLLDQKSLGEDSLYRKLKKRFPDITLWGGNRYRQETIAEEELPEGGIRLIFLYRLLDGCRACQVLGNAWYAFDFDKDGKFQGTKLMQTKSLIKADGKKPPRR